MLFIDNKYTKCYFSIINAAKSRISGNSYTEIHHIIPKSLGGSNEPKNLVSLSSREHFICHLLLIKMLAGISKRKMSFAFWSMCNRHNTDIENVYQCNSRIYELSRKQFIISNKILHIGSKRSQETKQKISEGQKGRIGGMQNKNHSEETKQKISNSNKGIKKPLSEQRKKEISQQFLGSKQTETHISKRISSRKENGFYKNEIETKRKMSESAKLRERYKCHCGKECSISNYKRWHGNNCKINIEDLAE